MISINKKPLADAPARLQRLLMRVQKYDYTLQYVPGRLLVVADTLSRAYPTINDPDNQTEEDVT